jgi:hypothetical protein
MKDHPYYYAGGATFDPRINLSIRDLHVGGQLVASLFNSFDGRDRDQEMKSVDLHFRDHEARGEAWLGYDLGSMSFLVDARATERGGSVAGVKDSTAERSLIATVGYRI